ncbi:MAG: hypothetical protein NZ891_06930, partial [bacterium]|nr:hypothetical protein [bacterium]MDW8164458.1 hypothetical protein [Candidatus Omnitrophota bacterium]
YPGRIIREIEKRGYKGIFFQGFCGDINPFVFKVKWEVELKEILIFMEDIFQKGFLRLKKFSILFLFSQGNGDIGYIPTKKHFLYRIYLIMDFLTFIDKL